MLAVVLGAPFALAVACGGGGDPARPSEVDAAPPVPPAPTPDTGRPFGLDARPANPTCRAPARPPSASAVKFEQVFVDTPLFPSTMLAQPPGDPRVFIVQLQGEVVAFPRDNPPTDPPPVVLRAPLPIAQVTEGGLFGIAFHPRYAQNGLVYITYTATSATSPANVRSIVARMRTTDGGNSFGEYAELISFDQPDNNHNGGGIAFGPDGFLYLGFGDGGGNGGDPFFNGQRKTGFFSKVLRIDVDSPPAPGLAYAIPDGNPFKNGGGEPATYAMGLRNPFRISIDPPTGDLWIADVGEEMYEEIDRVRVPGANFGWPCREGAHDYLTAPPSCPTGTSGLVEPVYDYAHNGASASVTGGLVYRGKAIPSLVGAYIFGDFSTGEISALDTDPVTGATRVRKLNDQGPSGSWGGFSADADGEIYAFDVTARVFKMLPASAPQPSTFPQKLSQTGCVDASDPTRLAPGVIPYTVSAELWADGADKERGFALPDGARIDVAADGDLTLPVGAVTMKTFRLGGKPVETRLFVRHDDGDWAGYSYEWDDAGRDATLLVTGKVKAVGAQTWTFPSRGECLQCHTAAAGRSLGLELPQLNRDYLYPATNRTDNQLRVLDHIGVLSAPLAGEPSTLPTLPALGSTAPAEARARAYLHANCSFCHRPKGPTPSEMDLRVATPFGATGTCQKAPRSGDLGIAGATLLTPGDPGRSLISARMRRTGLGRMPPLATLRVHEEGAAVVDAWISGLAGCP